MRAFLLQMSGAFTDGAYEMPLGLPCLGAMLRKHGHEVAALDLNFPARRIPDRYLKADMEVVERIRAFRPDILGEMLEATGFEIDIEHSAGAALHYLAKSRLSHRRAHALAGLRLPSSLAAWTMFVCGRGSKALDIVSQGPAEEIASPAQAAGSAGRPRHG